MFYDFHNVFYFQGKSFYFYYPRLMEYSGTSEHDIYFPINFLVSEKRKFLVAGEFWSADFSIDSSLTLVNLHLQFEFYNFNNSNEVHPFFDDKGDVHFFNVNEKIFFTGSFYLKHDMPLDCLVDKSERLTAILEFDFEDGSLVSLYDTLNEVPIPHPFMLTDSIYCIDTSLDPIYCPSCGKAKVLWMDDICEKCWSEVAKLEEEPPCDENDEPQWSDYKLSREEELRRAFDFDPEDED